MDAEVLKTEALCWLRFTKKLEYVATEAGGWNADVLGLGDKYSIEVEVKVSKSDLRREFESKKTKHFLYNGVEEGKAPSRHTPNYFYFYVPWWLEEEALKLIQEHSPKAGLAVYGQSADKLLDGKKTYIAKRPAKLHDRAPGDSMRRAVLLRMGSELCGRYLAHRGLVDCIDRFMGETNKTIVENIQKLNWPVEFLERIQGDSDGNPAPGQEDKPESGKG